MRVWELPYVAVHYQDEAAVILESEFKARVNIAAKGGSGMSGPGTVSLPEF